MEDGTTAIYLCSEPYAPQREHEIYPFDSDLGIAWPFTLGESSLSAKDDAAPTLAEALADGLLPKYDEVTSYRAGLAG
jgi:dTDP-4-dehydrorhamnose 3,5-epimerase